MSSFDFSKLGNCMSFHMKVQKHMGNGNCDRVKDYLTHAFDNVDPKQPQNHPCWEIIKEAEEFLNSHGWKAGLSDWGEDKGVQYTCVSPDNKWYRSRYQHH